VGKIKTSNGKIIDYEKPFNCLQTTTSNTFTILKSPDPLSAYKQWLVANNYKNNLLDLEEFVKESNDNGFKIEVSYI
jgi:hypothetical protein